MAREIVEVTVDGRDYQIANMSPFKSFKILTRLTKMVAPSAGKIADGLTSKAEDGKVLIDEDLAGETVGKILEVLADRLDENQLEQTLRELLEVVLKGDGTKLRPEIELAGEVPHMLAIAGKVIEVEYGGFLPLLGSLGLKAKKPQTSSSGSPQT